MISRHSLLFSINKIHESREPFECDKYHNQKPIKRDQISVTEFLKLITRKPNDVSSADHEALLASYDELAALDDDLITLLLDNTAIDVLYNHMQITMENLHNQMKRIAKGEKEPPHAGSFGNYGTLTICTTSCASSYTDTLLHELTHATSFYSFRLNPYQVKKMFPDINNTEDCLNFLRRPMLAFPQENGLLRTRLVHTHKNLNPAKLKFAYCAKDDIKKFNKDDPAYTNQLGSSNRIETIFSKLHYMNLEDNENYNLAEILPVYMELRLELLRLANQKSFSSSIAHQTLAKILPRVHAYCETDFKKVLKYRLYRQNDELLTRQIASGYIAKFGPEKQEKIAINFRLDGNLEFYKR